MPLAENDPFFNGVARVTVLWYRLLRLRKILIRSHLKNKMLVQCQGGLEFQPTGILKYFEELKRELNTGFGSKDIFEIASIMNHGSVESLQDFLRA